jgi:hypothetical protein
LIVAAQAIALSVYTALLAEAFIRIADPQPLMPRYVTGTTWGVRGNIPNARYWHHTPEVDVEYRINGQGMRSDREFTLVKPPETCRIELYGDSFFFGFEVDLENSFAGQLESRLKASGIPVEVLNLSVSGFGTAEMLRTYEGFGSRFDPDVVIFSWDFLNDRDNVRSGLYRVDGTGLHRANTEYLPGVKIQDFLIRYRIYRLLADHSHLFSFIRERLVDHLRRELWLAMTGDLAAASTSRDSQGERTDATVDDTFTQAPLELSERLLQHAQEVIAADGHDFFLVEIPRQLSRTQFQSTVDMFSPAVRSQLKVVSTLNALTKAARPDLKLFYERGNGHLTPAGYRVLVDETVRALTASRKFTYCSKDARAS